MSFSKILVFIIIIVYNINLVVAQESRKKCRINSNKQVLDFVKKERWVDNHNTDYVVKSDGTDGTNSIEVKNGGSIEDGTIRRRMSK